MAKVKAGPEMGVQEATLEVADSLDYEGDDGE
jgi:hypothetical protein